MISKAKKREEIRRAKKNPWTTAPAVGTRCEDLVKGIRQLQENLQRGSMKLCEPDDEWARLRKRSMTLDEEIHKLETKVMQVGYEKMSMKRPSLASPTTVLEEIVALLLLLQLHLTNQGKVPYKEGCDAKACGRCPQPGLAGKVKPRTRGVTT